MPSVWQALLKKEVTSLTDTLKTTLLFDCKTPYLADFFSRYEYPWQMLPHVRAHISALIESGLEGFSRLSPNVWVGQEVAIHPSATIEGPTIIGHRCQLRPGAYIRGNVITGEGCVIGNSTELKNCILLDGVQVPHYNYVGDSVLGNGAHMGAGAVCSNLKADGQAVAVKGEQIIPTGLRKFGGILADGVDIGCGCVLNPGTVVGKNTRVYPLTALRGVYPGHSIVKATNVVVDIIPPSI